MSLLDQAAEPDPAAGAIKDSGPERRSLGRAVALLSVSRLLEISSSFVLGLFLRGILGPARVGIWNYVDAWRQQLAGATFGLHYASDREMPILRARGQYREEDEVRWLTFTWTILEALVLAAGFWIYWLLDRGHLTRDVALGLGLVPILATLTSVVSVYEGFLINRKHFELEAWLAIGLFFLDWTLLLLAWLGGVTALLWGLLVTWSVRVAVYALVIRRRRVFSVRFTLRRLRRKVVLPMLRFGFPVSIFSLLFSLLQRLDSLVIGGALGTTQLGLYYLGPQIAASLSTLPNALSLVAYPNLMETFGRHGMEGLKPDFKRFQQAMLLMSPAVAAVGVFAVQFLVEVFLPAFRPGLAAMKIVIVSVVFTQTSLLSLQLFLATKRILLVMWITAAALAAQGAVLGAGAIAGLDIVTVAWSAVAGQATFALLSLIGSARLAGITRHEALEFWARLPVGWVTFAGLILAIDAIAPTTGSFGLALVEAVTELAVFSLIAVALLWLLDRGALRASRELMATRRAR